MTEKSLHAFFPYVVSFCLCTAGATFALKARAGEGVRSIGIPDFPVQDSETGTVWSYPQSPPGTAYRQFERFAALGDWGHASDLVDDLEQKYPQWRMPADMRRRLNLGLEDLRIRDAISAGDWGRALSLLGNLPERTCENGFRLWARADALTGSGDDQALRRFFTTSLRNCSEPVQVSLLERATQTLDADGLQALLGLPVLQSGQFSEELRIALDDVHLAANRKWYNSLLASGDVQAASAMALASGDTLLQRQAGWDILNKDAGMAVELFEVASQAERTPVGNYGFGLALFRNGEFTRALDVLTNGGSDFGIYREDARKLAGLSCLQLSIAAEAEGRTEDAVTMARKAIEVFPGLRAEAEMRAGSAWLATARKAHDRGDYTKAEQAAREAMRYPTTGREGQIQLAWVKLNDGDADQALANFVSLYDSEQEAAVLDGLILAAQQTRQLKHFFDDKELPAELRLAAGQKLSETALLQDRFYAAYDYAPDLEPRLRGLTGFDLTQSIAVRRQDGGGADGNLEGITSRSEVSWSAGRSRITAGLAALDMDRVESSLMADMNATTLWSPYMRWSREGVVNFAAEIGTTPIGADVPPVPIGTVEARYQADALFADGKLFSRSRRDSALALSGTQETTGTPAYGRVVESGLSLGLRKRLSRDIMAGFEMTASQLKGRRVTSNSRRDLSLSVTRNIPLKDFSYLSTGPFVELDSYDRNLNAYTPGYGGYFSPQSFLRTGWSLNFLTEELGRTLIRGNLSVAHEITEQDPLYTIGSGQGRQKSSALSGGVDVAAGMMLNKNWVLVGSVAGISSEAFEDVQVGLTFKYIPGGRQGLIRQDLSPDPFAGDLWGR